MHRYMDNTQDWMENVTEILDQYAANERRLQGLPVEEKPKDSEVDTKESQEVTDVSEDKPKVPEEKAEPKIAELDEDEKEKLREKNKDLMKEFVVSFFKNEDIASNLYCFLSHTIYCHAVF